jgi:hypothetical protein
MRTMCASQQRAALAPLAAPFAARRSPPAALSQPACRAAPVRRHAERRGCAMA